MVIYPKFKLISHREKFTFINQRRFEMVPASTVYKPHFLRLKSPPNNSRNSKSFPTELSSLTKFQYSLVLVDLIRERKRVKQCEKRIFFIINYFIILNLK